MAADNPAARSVAAKILLPAVPPTTLARPVLESRLDEALQRRLTVVVAGPGFGKSTLVASWAARQHCAWHVLSADDRALLRLAAVSRFCGCESLGCLMHVHEDVESFLAAIGEGLALAEAGQPTRRFPREGPLRGLGRTPPTSGPGRIRRGRRALATAAESRRDYDAAARFLLRVLERDRYDEPAQVTLVGSLPLSSRHGEARRFYRAYCARMREIGVEPAPYPGAQAA